MNTSDQSLFPIDSAFKRRWDWKYIKITDSGKGYTLAVNGNEYDWWDFLKAINHHIGTQTSQEDKKLGYFFVKATKNADGKHVISADKFLSKVLFFLYGDVYKDYGFDDVIFQGEDNQPMEFSDYFDENGNAVEPKIEKFLQNLGLEPKTDVDSDNIEEIDEDFDEYSLVVTWPDGKKLSLPSKNETYIEALKRIGIDRAAEGLKDRFRLKDVPVISRIKSPKVEGSNYKYVQVGDWYVLTGIDNHGSNLRHLSKLYNLNLDVKGE